MESRVQVTRKREGIDESRFEGKSDIAHPGGAGAPSEGALAEPSEAITPEVMAIPIVPHPGWTSISKFSPRKHTHITHLAHKVYTPFGGNQL